MTTIIFPANCDANEKCISRNGKCENTLGSFRCLCDEGFSLSLPKPVGDDNSTSSSTDCVDDDECALGLHHCHPTAARCTNTNGSYECACLPGFKGDGFECQVGRTVEKNKFFLLPLTVFSILVMGRYKNYLL